MPLIKCCVQGCDSTNVTHKLFCMPNNNNLRTLWMAKLAPTSPYLLGITTNQLMNKRVCRKHFDETQFDQMGVRIRYSYPCLFTEDEFFHGVPLCSDQYHVLNEHNYCSYEASQNDSASGKLSVHMGMPGKSKSDHTYFRDAFHKDHSYFKKVTNLTPAGDTSFKREIHQKIYSAKEKRQDGIQQQQPAADATPSGEDAEDIAETEETREEPSAIEDDDFAPPSPSPPSPLPKIDAKSAGSGTLFSWQKSELIPADDVEEPPSLEELEDRTGVSLYCDDTPAPQTVPQVPEASIKEVEYRCKDCGEIIDGFQFWCVQCFGCVLCGACEARGTHKRHYVLRAPPHRPYKQTQVVLASIRHQLQNENMLTQLGTDDDGVKLEVKEESPEEECSILNTVPLGQDPLDAADPLRHEPAPDEPHHTTAAEETAHHPFKRPRLADYIERGFATRGPPLQVKVTSRPEPQEQILINLDDVDDQVEYVTEELGTDDEVREDEYTEIETLDDTNSDSSIEEDADSIDSRIVEDEDVRVNETVEALEEDAVDSRIDEDTDVVTTINTDGVRTVEAEGIFSVLTSRRVRREETGMFQVRGSPESMVRTLPSEAVVELRPLSSVELRKWTADSKKRRK